MEFSSAQITSVYFSQLQLSSVDTLFYNATSSIDYSRSASELFGIVPELMVCTKWPQKITSKIFAAIVKVLGRWIIWGDIFLYSCFA